MKKLLLIITSTLMLYSSPIKAQITLDRDITNLWAGMGDAFYLAQISPSETKYVFLDTLTNTFSLLNMDFTSFQTNISVPEPFLTGMQPLYITRTLFDCDSSNIEYAFYSPTDVNRTFRVMRTDGSVLLQVDSANGPFCIGSCLGMSDVVVPIRNTSDGAKLFLQKFSPNRHVYVYSLCGELPLDVFDFTPLQQSFVSVFPNPALGFLTFRVSLPDNMLDYDLVLFDSYAREIKRERLAGLKTTWTVDMENFNSGLYYYSLYTKNQAYKLEKFILTK